MSILQVDTIQGKTTANAVAMPSGSVVQVGTQVAVNGLQTSATSTSYTAVGNGLIASITPRFASSKIKVHLTYQTYVQASQYIAIKLYRSVAGGSYAEATDKPPVNAGYFWDAGSFNFIDEPSYSLGNTISYQPYYRGHSASNAVYFGWGASDAGSKCIICCEEIKG
tara:strand:- start:216 stop:716 length:501 start_codon:yes stop_codon:yes gene_type:complete